VYRKKQTKTRQGYSEGKAEKIPKGRGIDQSRTITTLFCGALIIEKEKTKVSLGEWTETKGRDETFPKELSRRSSRLLIPSAVFDDLLGGEAFPSLGHRE